MALHDAQRVQSKRQRILGVPTSNGPSDRECQICTPLRDDEVTSGSCKKNLAIARADVSGAVDLAIHNSRRPVAFHVVIAPP